MATDYFDFLNQSSQQEKPATEEPKSDGLVNLTVRADADCQVVCDGDSLLLLNANQIVKEKAPVGQHILQFISIEHPDICVEKIVDWPDSGKNYLVIVNELKPLIAGKAKQVEEKKAAADAKAREEADYPGLKAEAEKPKENNVVENVVERSTEHCSQQLFNEYGDLIYAGDVINGKRDGNGVAFDVNLASGNSYISYKGEWKDDKRNGRGVEYYNDGKTVMFDGEFKDNTWIRGTEYSYGYDDTGENVVLSLKTEGEWNDRWRPKDVIFRWSDGVVLEHRSGHAKMTLPNGCVYEGDFPEDTSAKVIIKKTCPNGEIVVGVCRHLSRMRFFDWCLEIDSPSDPLILRFDDEYGGLDRFLRRSVVINKTINSCVIKGNNSPGIPNVGFGC